MQLFYNPTITETTEVFSFDKDESRHIIKVLRKKDTDILHVTNGLGFLFTTEITLASDRTLGALLTVGLCRHRKSSHQ